MGSKELNPSEPQPIPEIVGLDEEFKLFSNKLKVDEYGTLGSPPIILRTGILPDIPFEALLEEDYNPGQISPFTPGRGYRITQADLDLEKRVEKLMLAPREESPNHGLLRVTNIWPSEVAEGYLGDTIYEEHAAHIQPKYNPLIGMLRLQLAVSSLFFEAIPRRSSNGHFIDFEHFYPTDLGPLASGVYKGHWGEQFVEEGSRISVSTSNTKQWATLQGRFVLVNR